MSTRLQRTISVFTITMINVAAVGTVKNWPVAAEFGLASILLYVIAALIFFFPISLVSAELATGWPKIGGVFVWVKEAFGHRAGFLAIWILWVENVVWYPTILSFIGATLAYMFYPELANNKFYMVGIILAMFWGATFANMRGMRTSGMISSMTVIFGAFIPGIIIIALGFAWYFGGHPTQIAFTGKNLLPDMSSIDNLVFFTGLILNLAGMEMSAIHARDVKNPQRDYPRAMILSAIIILGLSILGILAIALVIPQAQISLASGSMQAFSYFMTAYGLKWTIPIMAALIAIGAFGSMSTWIVGPSKGLLAAAQSGDLPPFFRGINKHGMPRPLLIGQAVIVTVLSLMFIMMPTINSAFWILSVLVTQLYLVMYLMMFTAAIKLRYTKPDVKRAYKIPGGNFGMWVIASIGILACIFTLFMGFFPPSQIKTGNTVLYVGFLIVGMVISCLAPSIILLFKKPHWARPLSHEKGMD